MDENGLLPVLRLEISRNTDAGNTRKVPYYETYFGEGALLQKMLKDIFGC